ncbi:MAG: hypothetical protein J6A94_12855 [Lachnospiraceae bacterium]|nr:hypothetical protein [Lachnospiraceae bacterium]
MIYNVYFDVFAVIISFFSIILAFTKKDFWKRQNFILFILLVATFVASLLDILSSIGNSYIVEWSYGLRDVLNYGYLAVQNVMPYFFCLYIVFLIDLDKNLSKRQRRLFHIGLSIPYVVDVILLFLNHFIREVFYYDSNRVYTHDWGMIVLYANALLYMIFNYYLMMRYGKEVRFAKKATVYLFLTASLVAVVFQIIVPTILLQLSIEALCLSGILFTVENENDILHSILLYFFLLILCLFAQVDIIPDVFPWRMISSVYFLALGVLLVIYFAERIADRGQLKRWMLFCAWLIVLFMFCRMVKYEAFPADSALARYTWYLYYLPMLYIPLCTFYATLCIEGEAKREFAKVKFVFGAITFLLFLSVLSNDFHQKVFCFREGFSNWDRDYTHGFGYFVVIAWTYFLYAFSIVVMFRKCRLSKVKRKWWITLIPFVLGITMQLLIALGEMPKINGFMVINFPEAVCFMIALFWECCIRIGLIPTNKGYGELMKVSSLALQITDKNGKTIYKSISANELEDIHKNRTEPILLDENTELYCEQISGGYTYWQNDISELNEINKRLEEVHSLLAEETELIRLENELKERQVSIEQRTKLYELINSRTLTQSKQIAKLAEEALEEKEAGIRSYQVGYICFLGAYIKRYANLMLLAENEPVMSSAELGMAIAESLRYLGNMNIPCMYVGNGEVKLPTDDVILLYEIFERLVEDNLPKLQAVYVKMEDRAGLVLKITLEGVCAFLTEDAKDKLFQMGIPVTIKHEDVISYIRFRLTKEV